MRQVTVLQRTNVPTNATHGTNNTLPTPTTSGLSFQEASIRLPTPIQSVKLLGTAHFTVLTHGTLYLLSSQLVILETLPFTDITQQHVLGQQVAVATKNSIVWFELSCHNGVFEMTRQQKFTGKVEQFLPFKGSVVWTNGSSIYKDQETLISGFFRQEIHIVALDNDRILVSRGKQGMVITEANLEKFEWEQTPTNILTVGPFVILSDKEELIVKEAGKLASLQSIPLTNIASIDSCGDTILVQTSNDESVRYQIMPYLEIVASMSLHQAIAFTALLSIESFPERDTTMRQLQIKQALELFRKGHVQKACHAFMDFNAPPSLVLGLINTSESTEGNDLKLRAVARYITTQRRKLSIITHTHSQQQAANSDNASIITNATKLEGSSSQVPTVDEFLDGLESLDQVWQLLDTKLFQIYLVINPGLVGPLLRLHNHLDPEVVETELTQRGRFRDLYDFLFARGLYQRAIELITLNADDPIADDKYQLLMKYLLRLESDQLDIVLQYAEDLIKRDPNNGVKLFIDSGVRFDPIRVQKFLTQFEDLELKFLESEEWEQKSLNLRLVELYVNKLINSQATDNEIKGAIYAKLETILKTRPINLQSVLSKLDQLKDQQLKTIVLFRLNRHHEAIDILLANRDNGECIKYLARLQQEQNVKYNKVLAHALETLLSYEDSKTTIVTILANPALTQGVSLSSILDLLIESKLNFKIADLQAFLSSSLTSASKQQKSLRLAQNLKSLALLSTKEKLAQIHSFKLQDACQVCGKAVNGVACCVPVSNEYNKNDHVMFKSGHFGCLQGVQVKERKKMRVVKLGDWSN